ncbi:alpha/beta hydrolase [Glycomyces sp. NRRL B-16210]|uniref:alpha/beta hydrolase n=1 Tax=Glycomyces sp. NRRL B-16210 TaxID=1463821 RepID=UPI0009DEDFC9|nr:alpha/beta hydrolase [Glycomyces sp. NRRL B-16210]
MSEMTWQQLRDLDCGAVRALGDSWKTYVDGMLDHTARLRTDVIEGHLGVENYESDTATQVREQIGLTADRFEDDLSDYATTRIATSLHEAADAFEAEQGELKELVPLIESHDFDIEGPQSEYDVNLSGGLHQAILTLNPPQWLCDMVGIKKPDGFWDWDTLKSLFSSVDLYGTAIGLAGQYQDWLRAVMARAHDADDDAAAALKEMRENPSGLPPHLGATYDDLIDDYKDALSSEVADEARAIADGTSGMSPEQVNQWWEGLSDAEREALIAEHPEWVGPVDGIPTEARDTANRTLLDNRIDSLDDQIAAKERTLAGLDPESDAYERVKQDLDNLKGDRKDLSELQAIITDEDGNPAMSDKAGEQHYLLGFDTEGSGQAIVAVGNPDTADHVNTLVPGTTTALAGIGGSINRADTMSLDAQNAAPGDANATVMWLGYDAPDTIFPEAMQKRWADGAAEDLENFTRGLTATGQEGANHTLTGHSYGTTVIGHAATQRGVDADNLVFVASPGVGTDTASALGVDEQNVWATTNSLDPIQLTPEFLHGNNPIDDDFGGNTFHSDTGAWNDNNHSTYWQDTNQVGRDSIAYIATGNRPQ